MGINCNWNPAFFIHPMTLSSDRVQYSSAGDGDNSDVVFLAEALRSAGKFSGGGCSVQQLVNTLESKKIDCSENDGGGLLDHFQALDRKSVV